VQACSDKGVWGPWSKTWSFTVKAPIQPVDVSLESGVLRWMPNPAGETPVRYRIYGSDERGFSISDEPYDIDVGVSTELPRRRPANFVAETERTELAVLGADLELPNANKAFYRVVAVDANGTRSGPSDAAAAPRPFISGTPGVTARRGMAYQGRLSTIRSLGDLRVQWVDENAVPSFWDIEKPLFVLQQGPSWLRIDERSGRLSGVPDAAGTADVVVKVALNARSAGCTTADRGPGTWALGRKRPATSSPKRWARRPIASGSPPRTRTDLGESLPAFEGRASFARQVSRRGEANPEAPRTRRYRARSRASREDPPS